MSRILDALPTTIILAGLLCLSAPDLVAQADGAYNTTPYDSLNPDPGAAGRYSALWGYTAPDGREYAILGGYSGTHIIDITEKPIREVAFIRGNRSGWREMKTWGTYAYVVSEGGGGLQIIDLSSLPDTARLVKEDTSAFRTGHTISQEGDWIYVHGMNVEAGYNEGTMIFEVATDPLNPVLVGSYARGYVHDATIRNDTMYAAMINDGRLDIVYLGEDRTSSSLVNEITYPGAGTHSSDLSGDGTYIMTTDEVGSTAKTMKVWDRSDVDDIVKVADWTPVPDAIIHNVRRKGDLAYIAWYTAGVRIADISDPRNPVEIGFYDFHPGGGNSYTGNWEVYPYFPSGKIIASSTIDGLHVFTFNGSGVGSAVVTVRDSLTGEPLAGVALDLPELGRTEVSNAEGKIILAAAEGVTRFTTGLINYRRKGGELELKGEGNDVEILLAPLAMRNVLVQIKPKDSRGEQVDFSNPFVWNLVGRPEGGAERDGEIELRLPVDSSYAMTLGAWGYYRQSVDIPAGEEAGPIVVTVEPGYYDDADLDLGWSLSQPDDDASAGYWERGTPVGVSAFFNGEVILIEPSGDATDGEGGMAFMTDIAPSSGIAPGLADVDSGRVTLTSPVFNLSPERFGTPDGGFEVSFQLWFTNDAVPFFPADDRLYVRLSNDGGATWVDVLSLSEGLDGWTRYEFSVEDFLIPTDAMLFRVVVSDSMEQGWVEAGLDEFRVEPIYLTGVADPAGDLAGLRMTVRPLPIEGSGTVFVTTSARIDEARIDLYNALGEPVLEVWRGDLMPGTLQLPLDLEKLASGAYHLVLRNRSAEARRLLVPVAR